MAKRIKARRHSFDILTPGEGIDLMLQRTCYSASTVRDWLRRMGAKETQLITQFRHTARCIGVVVVR